MNSENPLQFLLKSVREALQHVNHVLADAGFLNLKVLREILVKVMIRGNLKGFRLLSSLLFVEKFLSVGDRVYVALWSTRVFIIMMLFTLRIGHFIFVTNFKGDPYELAEVYRLRWQIEVGLGMLGGLRIGFSSFSIILFLIPCGILLITCFLTTRKKPLPFDSFIKLL